MKIIETELNSFLFHSRPNGLIRQAHVQGLDFESVTFQQYFNMFEHMEISESIYEGIVETSYLKKVIIEESNYASHCRKMRV